MLLVVGGAIWWWLGHKAAGSESEKEPALTARVQVAPLRRGQIERTLTAYGTAEAAPSGIRSVAFPFECRVVAVTANVGQTVTAGDAVLQIEPSADARLALDTAQSAQEAAGKALHDVQSRFQAHLATNIDLQTAQSVARDTQLKFQSLRSRSPGGDGIVKALAAGLITKLPAAPGTVVPAGGPLVELAVENRLEARLGIAPADAAQVKAGQSVHLFAVQARGDVQDAAAEGRVRVVGGSVDPATRMVDAFVTLDTPGDGAALILIGAYLRAGIVLEKKDALLAPRAAVLPTEGGGTGEVVFTVRSGHAVKHEVTTASTMARTWNSPAAAMPSKTAQTWSPKATTSWKTRWPSRWSHPDETKREGKMPPTRRKRSLPPRLERAKTAPDAQGEQLQCGRVGEQPERSAAGERNAMMTGFSGWVRHHRRSILFLLALLVAGRDVQRMAAAGESVPAGELPARGGQLRRGRPPRRAHGDGGDPPGGTRRARRARRAAGALDHQPGQLGTLRRFRLGPGHGFRAPPGEERRQPDPARPARRNALRGAAHGPHGVPRARLQPDQRHALAGGLARSGDLPACAAALHGQRRGEDRRAGRRHRGNPRHHRPGPPRRLRPDGGRSFQGSHRRQRARRRWAACRTTTSSTCS